MSCWSGPVNIQKISDEDIAAGRHSMAFCSAYVSDGVLCEQPVRYRVTVVNSFGDGEYLDTEYFCELHKPPND